MVKAVLTCLPLQVRKGDQEMINEFGKLNNILMDNRADQTQIKVPPWRMSAPSIYTYIDNVSICGGQADLEQLDDAGTDVMMAVDGKMMLLVGEAFVEVTEDAATAYIEKKTEVS